MEQLNIKIYMMRCQILYRNSAVRSLNDTLKMMAFLSISTSITLLGGIADTATIEQVSKMNSFLKSAEYDVM